MLTGFLFTKMENGHIRLHRSLLTWDWYDDANTCRLFIHLLLKANWKAHNWRGQIIERGQLITSLETLSKETGLTVKQIRLALNKLEKTGEIEKKGTNKFTLVTLVNYEKFQTDEEKRASKGANKGQTKDKQRATNEEREERKKEIRERKQDFRALVSENKGNYSQAMLKAFFEYWTEHGPKDKKMRFEKQTSFDVKRRLSTWYKREKEFNGSEEKREYTKEQIEKYFAD